MILTRNQYGWLTLGFVLFVIYGSLVPLDFVPLSWEEGWDRFVFRITKPVEMGSRADWLANILLFIPLGFFSMGFCCVDRRQSLRPVFFLVLLCGLFSGILEWIQIWFPPRHTNINDIVGETFGALVGTLVWFFLGQKCTEILRHRWQTTYSGDWAIRYLVLYLFLMVVVLGIPFDLSLGIGDLQRKYRNGLIRPIPFDFHGSLDCFIRVKQSIWNMVYFFPIGILLTVSRRPDRSSRWNRFQILGIGFLFVVFIEFMQLFVMSRLADSMDLISGTVGIFLGWIWMHFWKQPKDTESNQST